MFFSENLRKCSLQKSLVWQIAACLLASCLFAAVPVIAAENAQSAGQAQTANSQMQTEVTQQKLTPPVSPQAPRKKMVEESDSWALMWLTIGIILFLGVCGWVYKKYRKSKEGPKETTAEQDSPSGQKEVESAKQAETSEQGAGTKEETQPDAESSQPHAGNETTAQEVKQPETLEQEAEKGSKQD